MAEELTRKYSKSIRVHLPVDTDMFVKMMKVQCSLISSTVVAAITQLFLGWRNHIINQSILEKYFLRSHLWVCESVQIPFLQDSTFGSVYAFRDSELKDHSGDFSCLAHCIIFNITAGYFSNHAIVFPISECVFPPLQVAIASHSCPYGVKIQRQTL